MTFENILSNLKSKTYSPLYFLMGDESYFIDKITDYIAKNVLTDSEKDFNQTILYGKDTDIANVINSAKRFPMMAQKQVVIVKEAQNIRNIDNLVYYAQNPLKSTILVINYKYKTLDKRKKLYKELEKNGVLFEAKKLYDDKVPDWITKYLAAKGYQIQPTGALMLTEFLGNDLNKIVMELDKLILVIPATEKLITPVHIEENIGISKDYNNIELQKALIKKDHLKAFRIVDHFGQNQKDNPLVVTLAMLYSFFNKVLVYHFLQDKSKQAVAAALKIHPFFAQDYIQAARIFPPKKSVEVISELRSCDLKSKGVGNISATPADLLKELVYKILH
ncbi:MAG: DNA polymerase III subunit delta [Bacteroidales bacterium]|nr:DNA polymerase III subunit delta [Bacteroidales bacterium]MBN2818466.1 DNA polymerase III subunit delta [Bacteroidales bacterium]